MEEKRAGVLTDARCWPLRKPLNASPKWMEM